MTPKDRPVPATPDVIHNAGPHEIRVVHHAPGEDRGGLWIAGGLSHLTLAPGESMWLSSGGWVKGWPEGVEKPEGWPEGVDKPC